MQKIRQHFYLKRIEDQSGVSGTGIVAIGAILPDGQCVLQWLTFTSSVAIYKNIEDVIEIHGHHGKTLVILGDPDEPSVKKRRTTRNTNKDSSSKS